MSDALLSTGAALLLAALGLAAVGLLTLAPLLCTLALAERRGAGTARWGALSALCSAAGLAVLVSARSGPAALALLGAALAWSGPVVLAGLGRAGSRVVGVRGRHE